MKNNNILNNCKTYLTTSYLVIITIQKLSSKPFTSKSSRFKATWTTKQKTTKKQNKKKKQPLNSIVTLFGINHVSDLYQKT